MELRLLHLKLWKMPRSCVVAACMQTSKFKVREKNFLLSNDTVIGFLICVSQCNSQYVYFSLVMVVVTGLSMLWSFLRFGWWFVNEMSIFKGTRMEWKPPLTTFHILCLDDIRLGTPRLLHFRSCLVLILWQLTKFEYTYSFERL